ncbi:uncharacterized protein BDV14DRAFT_187543 [Aspergillus stella-maris]|uniref:uncharacterized protein n=1 Tax=Aspergillus stella-maris TaxID=1810926 RepID=UPI003CCCD015
MPAAEFIAMASSPHFLGNPYLKTQHLVGRTKWEKIDDDLILGHHQMRVAHQKHADAEMKEVIAKGHSHGSATMTYRKVDGVWKFAGIEPEVRWTEFGGENLFARTKMANLSDLESHASDITAAVKTLVAQCQNLTTSPNQGLIPPDAPQEAHRARQSILSTISRLQTFLSTPSDLLHHLAIQTQLLSCLQWLGEFQVLACIPLTGSVPIKDVADLAGVPEAHLTRMIRMSATAGFLSEPQPGQVSHSALSAPFVTKPSYLDAVMFLSGTVAPAALQMPVSTQRFGPSLRPNETAYNLAFNNPVTFASTCEQRPKLQRQWPAFLRYGTINTEDRVTDLLSRLDHFRRGNISIVEVGARSIDRANTLATLYPSIRIVVQIAVPANNHTTWSTSHPATPISKDDLRSLTHSSTSSTAKGTSTLSPNITIQHRPPGTPQPITDATLYILHLPSALPTQPTTTLASRMSTELRAHLDILRSNPNATLILTPRLLPDPGAVNADIEASARLRDLVLFQLANEREIEMGDLMGVLNSVSDTFSLSVAPVAAEEIHQQTQHTWAVYAYTTNGESIPKVFPRPRALTAYGAHQLESAGIAFRNRYVSMAHATEMGSTKIENLSPYLLDNDDVKIGATADAAVLVSAQAFMQGAYPPLDTSFNSSIYNAELELADGSMISAPLGGYQYAPIVSHGVSDPQSLALSAQALCPRHAYANIEYIASEEYRETYEESAPFYNRLHDLALSRYFDAAASSYANATSIWEYLAYQAMHNDSLLDTISKEDVKLARGYADKYVFATNGGTSAPIAAEDEDIRAIAGSGLASSILNAFDNTIEGRGAYGKVTLGFGSDKTALSFISLLGLPSIQYPNFYSLPNPGASIVLELYSYENKTYPTYPDPANMFVDFWFRNGTGSKFIPYPFWGLGNGFYGMHFNEFKAEMQRLALRSASDWCQRCNSTAVFCSGVDGPSRQGIYRAHRNRDGLSLAVAGVIGAAVTIGVLTLAAVAAFFCSRTKKVRKPSFGGFKGSSKMVSDTDLTFGKSQWDDDLKVPAAAARRHERHGSWELSDRGSPSQLSPGVSSFVDEIEEEWRIHSGAKPTRAREHV